MEQKDLNMLTRFASYLGAAALGAFIGSVTTTVNQNSMKIGVVDVPYGLILGLICVAGFLVGLRLMSDDRWLPVAGAVGSIGMTFLLSQESPGGSIFVPNNEFGTMWVIGSALVTALVLVWPRIRPRVK